MAASEISVESVVKAVVQEAKRDQFGPAWKSVDALCAQSPAKALELATALLRAGLSQELAPRARTTRENILQVGREGANPLRIKIFAQLARVARSLFGDDVGGREAARLRAPRTRAALAQGTAGWTDEMLWVLLRSFATNAGSLERRKFVPKLLGEVVPTEPGGPGAMFLNTLRGVKNPRKRAAEKPKPGARPKVVSAMPPPATLAALRARPDDVASLAVLADWLLDQGDPAGELIRLELELRVRPREAALRAAQQAWLKTHPPASACLTLERVLGLPRVARFEFITGKADERAALSAFLASPAAQWVDSLSVQCGRVLPFKSALESLAAARPLSVTNFELRGNGSLEAGDFFSSKRFPRLERLELGLHKFARTPAISIASLKSLTVGVSHHNGPLSLALSSSSQLRTLSLSTAFLEEKFLQDVLRGKWALTGLGLFTSMQRGLWERIQTSPISASLQQVGAHEATSAPKGKTLLKDPFG